MNETITLSKETYDGLMQDRISLHYLQDCIVNGYKTHSGDYERAVFTFDKVNGSFVVVANSESETITELNKFNKELSDRLNDQPLFNKLFFNLYIKR